MPTTIEISDAAMTRLIEAEHHIAQLADPYLLAADVTCILTGADGEHEDDCTTHSHENTPEVVHLATTFIHSLRTLLGIGGNVYLESDTMLVAVGPSGYTVGMHFDGREWSVHS